MQWPVMIRRKRISSYPVKTSFDDINTSVTHKYNCSNVEIKKTMRTCPDFCKTTNYSSNLCQEDELPLD